MRHCIQRKAGRKIGQSLITTEYSFCRMCFSHTVTLTRGCEISLRSSLRCSGGKGSSTLGMIDGSVLARRLILPSMNISTGVLPRIRGMSLTRPGVPSDEWGRALFFSEVFTMSTIACDTSSQPNRDADSALDEPVWRAICNAVTTDAMNGYGLSHDYYVERFSCAIEGANCSIARTPARAGFANSTGMGLCNTRREAGNPGLEP